MSKTFIRDGVTCKKFGGYIFVQVGLVWMHQHRLIVEEFIGRTLLSEESVHHIDFNRENNSIDNLMLFPNQSEHQKFHLKLRQFGWTNPLLHMVKDRWNDYTQQPQGSVAEKPSPEYNSLGGL